MKKATKTFMSFLTAMTMTASAMGVTAYAEETNTAVVTESVQTDGVFSQGAEYHFIKGSDALILDGEGSFTAEEFDGIAKQFSPRAIVIGDNVDIPDSDSANNAWLKSMLELSSPYAVYAHKSSKIKESYDKMIDALENDLRNHGLNPDEVKIWLNYQFSCLNDKVDIYKDFTYDKNIVARGTEMEQYLMENGIEKSIAREIVSYYLYGLNYRVRRGLLYPNAKEIANPDGTEINEKTINNVRTSCLRAAEAEQDLIYNVNKKPNGEVSRFLAENGIPDNENKRLTLIYVTGKKSLLAFSYSNVRYDSNQKEEINTTDETEVQTSMEISEDATENAQENVTGKAKSEYRLLTELNAAEEHLRGDINVDGAVTYRDSAALAKILSTCDDEEQLPAYADYNEDGEVNMRDCAKIVVFCKENGSLGEKYKNVTSIEILKGDADLNGVVDLSDLIAISKYNLSNEAYPLINEVAFVNADMNEDDKVDGLDTSTLIENQLGK